MKKRLFFIFTLISLLLTSCKLSISDGINNFSTMPSNNSNVYKGDFKGEITHYSDDKGIHISVNLDENSIYNCVSVFEVSNGTDSLIATAKPAKDLYRYLFDKPCGDIGYEVSKEEDMDEQENTISTSSRTNYLNGKVDFHFYFIEPGKTYTFVVRVEEIAGKYKDIVTGTEGILHDITSKYNLTSPLHEDSVAYHYGKVFSETASSSINYDDILSAEYDSLQDLYKFKSTNFTDSKYPFNLISEKDAYFSATFTYKSDNSTITVPYQKPEEGNEGISLSKFVEQSSNAKFK